MFKQRKGVSEVVANVLIVLLVIVGIAVIWSVVKPTIDKGSERIQADCFTVSVEPVSCIQDPPAGTNSYDVVVKRNSGAGAIEDVQIVFSDGTNSGTVGKATAVTGLKELSTERFDNVARPGNVLGTGTVTVNAVVKSGGQFCEVISQPVTCTPYTALIGP